MSVLKRPRSVRVRLTLAYVAAMMAVLAVYAGVVYVSVRGSLSQALDNQLRNGFSSPKEMLDVRQLLSSANGEDNIEGVSPKDEVGSPWLQVWSENGEKRLY